MLQTEQFTRDNKAKNEKITVHCCTYTTNISCRQ